MAESGFKLVEFLRFEDTVKESLVTKQGDARSRRTYFSVAGGPHAFQIGTPRNGIVRPHFHRVDQFQFVFGGPRTSYKGDAIAAGHGLVHYADAYSTYGPIQAGEHEMDFVTLRPRLDHMIAYMPEERAKLVRTSRHRNVHRDIRLDSRRAPSGSEVLFEFEDGLAAHRVWAQAGGSLRIPDGSKGSGQYLYVLSGAVVHAERDCGPRAIGWVAPATQLISLVSGAGGADLLVLQFPSPTAEPGEMTPAQSQPAELL
jgi:hypothetical protein